MTNRDAIDYGLVKARAPRVLNVIRGWVEAGYTPEAIEMMVHNEYGSWPSTAAAFAGAARFIQKQKEEQTND